MKSRMPAAESYTVGKFAVVTLRHTRAGSIIDPHPDRWQLGKAAREKAAAWVAQHVRQPMTQDEAYAVLYPDGEDWRQIPEEG